ncbi:nucleotidyltransferase domain-containing protein [Stenotrophomonas oahuensis]|uniref:Nucleotidyltransferase domain-containing protein n=1 Tax=Stenotrophomonas oahuensis TaxID=3003271 RepID=A0ABY9YK30_9GAMM|nr:nucleotidyltransferase domain-containing protein [Stenotrophomonas sp. A5586]WNH51238.1 nucleotidyltransferase domain-containing protein [Stenotrophomonas sp. A5586]
MSNNSHLMDILFPTGRQRVLAVLLLQPEQSFHLRELARITGSHAGTLARELDRLASSGLLQRSEVGNQVHYRANRDYFLFDELAAIFRKTHGVVPALRDALAPFSAVISVAWIFGSVARGAEVSASDIDLLVVGDVGFADLVRAVRPVQELLQREVNPVLYAREEFLRRLHAGDTFARELLSKPKLLVVGDMDDVGKLAGNPPTPGTPG